MAAMFVVVHEIKNTERDIRRIVHILEKRNGNKEKKQI